MSNQFGAPNNEADQDFSTHDESRLRYYQERIRQTPVPALKRHGVVEADRDVVKLAVKDGTFDEKVQLRMLCQQNLHASVARWGITVWDHRILETDPIPDSPRYIDRKESGGRCALCGATRGESPLDVDHIIPCSRGGKHVLTWSMLAYIPFRNGWSPPPRQELRARWNASMSAVMFLVPGKRPTTPIPASRGRLPRVGVTAP